MPIVGNGKHSPVIIIGVYAALGYDITSANLSSPQTFELNANQRGPTLSKWLNINVAEAVVWGIGSSIIDKSPYPMIGIALGITSMVIKYKYAVASGQNSGKPDMENTETQEYDTGGY